jgi:hypothetical protein
MEKSGEFLKAGKMYIEKNVAENKARKRKWRNKKTLSIENYRRGNGNE